MGRSSFDGSGLTTSQAEIFKLSVSAACRKMTAEQILDLADHLHNIIRRRAARNIAKPRAACAHPAPNAALAWEWPL